MQAFLNKIQPWLWAGVWFSLPISLKANSLFLILFGIVTLLQSAYYMPKISRQQIILSILFILFFLVHASSLLFDPEVHTVKKILERKLSLVAIPVVIMLLNYRSWDVEKWAIRGFFSGLVISGLHMLAMVLIKAFSGMEWPMWTYHEFTKPYTIGAVYYSLYLSSAIIFLLYNPVEKALSKYKLALLIFFVILLLFSASKLFIGLTLPIILWRYFLFLKNKKSTKHYVFAVLTIVIIILGSIPFINRLIELKNTSLKIVSQSEFAYDTPFNGLTFRLLQWRLGKEILTEENAWLLGTGIGNSQELLNEKYWKYGIYTGNSELGDTGYLDYNFHNQFIETLVGTGIVGLLLLFLIIFNIFVRHRSKLFFPFAVFLLTLLFFMVESVLERQAGIVFFCLICCFFIEQTPTLSHTYGSNPIADTE